VSPDFIPGLVKQNWFFVLCINIIDIRLRKACATQNRLGAKTNALEAWMGLANAKNFALKSKLSIGIADYRQRSRRGCVSVLYGAKVPEPNK